MRRNHGWIWFFVVLAVLAVAAVAINWAYNVRQQLTPEQLRAAMELWAKNGPADYDLLIEKSIGSGATVMNDRIEMQIRQKKVVGGTLNGGPLLHRLWDEYDMPGWFGFVEEFLQRDTQPGAPRTFRVADFDPQTGALRRFVRRVSGTQERLEVRWQVMPNSSSAPPTELRGGQARPEG
jgi:hypothetical protein